jgi:2-(1,2-epoxy-1,2-dihydrophenyl)acetyl-CoA isomerase
VLKTREKGGCLVTEVIEREMRDSVFYLWINRPEVLNAINPEVLEALRAGFLAARDDANVRAVVISGRGRGFCSGQELNPAILQSSVQVRDMVLEMYNPVIEAMKNLQKPIIASVNGVAAGAGLSLAMAADLRIASDQANFSVAFSKIGLAPDSGASYYLPRLVGLSKAMEWAFLGTVIDAATALQTGLVNFVVTADNLAQATHELAVRLANGPTVALGLTKRALYEGVSGALTDALEREALYQQLASETRDFKEGVTAFQQKRAPSYQGH